MEKRNSVPVRYLRFGFRKFGRRVVAKGFQMVWNSPPAPAVSPQRVPVSAVRRAPKISCQVAEAPEPGDFALFASHRARHSSYYSHERRSRWLLDVEPDSLH